jgi:hypothetical protein
MRPLLFLAMLLPAVVATAEPALGPEALERRVAAVEASDLLCVCQDDDRAGRVGIVTRRRAVPSQLPQLTCALPAATTSPSRSECPRFTVLPDLR